MEELENLFDKNAVRELSHDCDVIMQPAIKQLKAGMRTSLPLLKACAKVLP